MISFLRGNREPRPDAPVEDVLDAVDRRMKRASKRPATLATDRLRMTRGLVTPIGNYFAAQMYDATADRITEDPEVLDFDDIYRDRPGAYMPPVMLAACKAEDILRKESGKLTESPQVSDPAMVETAAIVKKHSPVFYEHLVSTIQDGTHSGYVAPLNFATTYLHQRTGSREWDTVRDFTADDYLDTLGNPRFHRAMADVMLAQNGVWADYSSEIAWNARDVVNPKFMRVTFNPDRGGINPDLKERLLRARQAHNDRALKIAKTGEYVRITNGCPAARPHTGEPDLFERAGMGVLRAIGATEAQVTDAMGTVAMHKGFTLGQTVCKVVRDKDWTLPPISYDED